MKLEKKTLKSELQSRRESHPIISFEINHDLLNKALKSLLIEKLKKIEIIDDSLVLINSKNALKTSSSLIMDKLELNNFSIKDKIKLLRKFLSDKITESSLIVFNEHVLKSKRRYRKALEEALKNDSLENMVVNYLEEINSKK